jgi:hypothetical protein
LLSKYLALIPAPVRAACAALLFLVSWALLDAAFNHRYPLADVTEPKPWHALPWYLLPSLDVCVLLAIFAVLGWRKWRVPRPVTIVLAVLVTLVPLYRLADGLAHENYYRPVNLYFDLPLLPDYIHFVRGTEPAATLWKGALEIVAAVLLAGVASYGVLLYLQRYLARGWHQRGVFLGVVALFTALSYKWPADKLELHHGLFGTSVAPQLVDQIQATAAGMKLRRTKATEARAVAERLRQLPSDLDRLQGADVLLFLVESYGSALFRNPYLVSMRCPAREEFGYVLSKHGFYTASSFLESPIKGGGSWLAHTTMATGVVARDGLDFAAIQQTVPRPRTMAEIFQGAGYHTVLVQPGTFRRWPEGESRGFGRKYYSWDLEYEGPSFGWFNVTDEYLLDFIHRRELSVPRGPLFVQYALVSSHAPWTMLPLPVHDWHKLDRGRIYQQSHVLNFPIDPLHLEKRAAAYAFSLCYDFDVLQSYITERLTRDALVIILGDHQPPGIVTDDDPSWAVPIHVVSRHREIIDRFNEAGFTEGMIAVEPRTSPGLETLMPLLLDILSSGRAQGQAAAGRPRTGQ